MQEAQTSIVCEPELVTRDGFPSEGPLIKAVAGPRICKRTEKRIEVLKDFCAFLIGRRQCPVDKKGIASTIYSL